MNIPENSLKLVIKDFYSNQAFCDFLDTCWTCSAVCKTRLFNKSFKFLCIKEENNRKKQFMT